MEVLKENLLLKFNPNTLEDVRKEIYLSRDDISKILDYFEDWIAKQSHFTTRKFDRHYLETTLVCAKGSLERAKKTLDKLCTLKTLLPTFFSKYNAKSELIDSSGFFLQAMMPKLSKNNYRLYFNKLTSTNFDSSMLLDTHRLSIMMTEYIKAHDYFVGFIGVLDCRDVNIVEFVTRVNIINLRNTMSVLLEGYGLRVRGIYLLSTSTTVDILVTLLKQVVTAKVAGRIYVHKTLESLHEHVPKEIMPKEYGGEQKTLKELHENWVTFLSEEKNVAFFREIYKARTDEKYRTTAKYNDQILGMPGSFRTLTVV